MMNNLIIVINIGTLIVCPSENDCPLKLNETYTNSTNISLTISCPKGFIINASEALFNSYNEKCLDEANLPLNTGGVIDSSTEALPVSNTEVSTLNTGGVIDSSTEALPVSNTEGSTLKTGGVIDSSTEALPVSNTEGSTLNTGGVIDSSTEALPVSNTEGSTLNTGGVIDSSTEALPVSNTEGSTLNTGGVIDSSTEALPVSNTEGSTLNTGGVIHSSTSTSNNFEEIQIVTFDQNSGFTTDRLKESSRITILPPLEVSEDSLSSTAKSSLNYIFFNLFLPFFFSKIIFH